MMHTLKRRTKDLACIVVGVIVLTILTATPALAERPVITTVPLAAPRNAPAPIAHPIVLDDGTIINYLGSGNVQEQAYAAAEIAAGQGLADEPGVLETETEIGSGLTLFEPPDVCNDFNRRGRWQGIPWTDSYEQWGPYATDDGYFIADNVTIDRELSVGPGVNYDRHQSSVKIASNEPYEAGVMSPPISVRPGRTVRVRVNYLIYNHGMEAEALDFASMGVITKMGEPATYVYGHQRGVWSVMEQEVEAEEDQIVVMLQGHSPVALNSNIYFDNVQIFVNDRRVRNCRR